MLREEEHYYAVWARVGSILNLMMVVSDSPLNAKSQAAEKFREKHQMSPNRIVDTDVMVRMKLEAEAKAFEVGWNDAKDLSNDETVSYDEGTPEAHAYSVGVIYGNNKTWGE